MKIKPEKLVVGLILLIIGSILLSFFLGVFNKTTEDISQNLPEDQKQVLGKFQNFLNKGLKWNSIGGWIFFGLSLIFAVIVFLKSRNKNQDFTSQ